MIDCISVENMRRSDEHTIANLVPSLELMYRAAYGVYLATSWKAPVAIVAGSGNNGGDGYALAWILKNQGIDCAVFTVGSKVSADSAYYRQKAAEACVPVQPLNERSLDRYETVVDCLLGTGFQGALREDYRRAIELINRRNACTVSVDINSGMNGDTGAYELAVRSDLTVTIGFVKRGLVMTTAENVMKRLICVDIGIELLEQEWKIYSAEEPLTEGGISCPPWLDMNIIKSY